MSGESISVNMNMPIPGVGITSGPQWASDVNSCLSIIDAHTHIPGYGVPIPTSGININADFPFNNFNVTTARSYRFTPQLVVLSDPTDIGCLYEVGVDLYYNDGSGNNVRITQGGGVAGTPGSIGGLVSPASATYVSADSTFVWQSAANTPAYMDSASVILRNLTANSKGLTIDPPAAMASDFTITLPSLPLSSKFLSMDATGNIGASWAVDNSTLEVLTNVVQVKDGGITLAKLAAAVLSYLVPTGVIVAYAGTAGITGWLICDGTEVSRTTYSALFAVIGITAGSGNGTTTFNVPDHRGRFLRGVSEGTGRDPDSASRTAMNSGGNTGNSVNTIQGDATASNGLSASGTTSSDGSHTHQVVAGVTDTVTSLATNPAFAIANVGADYSLNGSSVTSTRGRSDTNGAHTHTVSSTVTSTDTETRPINAYVYWIIKT